jgi:hypothetical protein
LQASIVPAFLQGQGRELFKGAKHFLNFHASFYVLGCKDTLFSPNRQLFRYFFVQSALKQNISRQHYETEGSR